MPPNEIIGTVFVVIGVFFSLVGMIGMVRFPDVYCRAHATGKVATLGIMGILAGTAFFTPAVALKAIALLLFLLIAAPTAAHAIAAAAHRQNVPREVGRDDLGDKQFHEKVDMLR